MNRRRLVATWCLAAALSASGFCQEQALARLSPETRPDIPSNNVGSGGRAVRIPVPLRSSATSRAAAEALFVKSDLQRARLLSQRALRRDHQDGEALFVRMEVAGIEADYAATLDAAVQLCQDGAFATDDARVQLAVTRVGESAANTPEFRSVVPALRSLLANSAEPWPELQRALLAAAMDGVPGLDPYALSRAAGIVTDWRIVDLLGPHPVLDLDRPRISPSDDLAQNSYQGHAVENFQFPDGWIRLPDYLPRRGTFYAAGRFSSLTAGMWQVNVEGAGVPDLYVDGQRVLWTGVSASAHNGSIELTPGPHRVTVKFGAAAGRLRVAISEHREEVRAPLRAKLSLEEAAYVLAAEHYARGEFKAAVRQIDAVGSESSAALEFLLAQSLTKNAPASPESAAAWYKLQESYPEAVAADEALARQALAQHDFLNAMAFASAVLAKHGSDAKALQLLTEPGLTAGSTVAAEQESLWTERVVANPSCASLRGAMMFYAAHGLLADRMSLLPELDGCAPESLDYAKALSEAGDHPEAARALRKLVAAAPLNRAARLMLVRELQLAGEDEAAQRAAADWLHVAPNAENYHRLAAAITDENDDENASDPHLEFYAPYRQDAAVMACQPTTVNAGAAVVVLLDDHVAISRADGSVSLYVHTAKCFPTGKAVEQARGVAIPKGAQVLTLRVLHADGTTTKIDESAAVSSSSPKLSPGDTIDTEYALHFAGDGGIPEHAEVFQFVFGNFNEQVLHSRFVVLTPANRADGGVIITTGAPPRIDATVRNGMLERVWEKNLSEDDPADALAGSGIVRVVEQENGWTVPSNAERQRRIETIHPGPRNEDS